MTTRKPARQPDARLFAVAAAVEKAHAKVEWFDKNRLDAELGSPENTKYERDIDRAVTRHSRLLSDLARIKARTPEGVAEKARLAIQANKAYAVFCEDITSSALADAVRIGGAA